MLHNLQSTHLNGTGWMTRAMPGESQSWLPPIFADFSYLLDWLLTSKVIEPKKWESNKSVCSSLIIGVLAITIEDTVTLYVNFSHIYTHLLQISKNFLLSNLLLWFRSSYFKSSWRYNVVLPLCWLFTLRIFKSIKPNISGNDLNYWN